MKPSTKTKGLLVVYLVVVVVLVRRQITLVDEGEEEEEELCLKEDVVLVTDKAGVTDTVCADTVVMETNEIFLWSPLLLPSCSYISNNVLVQYLNIL